MKQLLKKILPRFIVEYIGLLNWKKRNYLGNSPQFIKEAVFVTYGVPNAQWIETGTFRGETTAFLAEKFPSVHTIEPGLDLFNKATAKFQGKEVYLYNDVSEKVLPDLLPKLNGEINFWLDGHYSAGITFKGDADCPVEDELKAISENLGNYSKITILIDDVRCFLPVSVHYADYPSIDYLVDWARKHKFNWRVEHDIFVMTNH